MRTFMKVSAAAATVVALAIPAHSQVQGIGGGGTGGRIGPPPEGPKPEDRVDEKAYKAAVDRIPAQAAKRDPWQILREKPQAK